MLELVETNVLSAEELVFLHIRATKGFVDLDRPGARVPFGLKGGQGAGVPEAVQGTEGGDPRLLEQVPRVVFRSNQAAQVVQERLLEKGHQLVAFNRSEDPVKRISKQGAQPAASLQSLVEALVPPRLIWLMVPYQAVEEIINGLVPFLQKNVTVVDGGNSPYKESMRRARELEQRGIDFLDAGVSGGPAGARNGACIMVGGKKAIFQKHEKLFQDLSVEKGYGYMGAAGAGHFVKMVHNGIEYGMMQAFAEGFSIMRAKKEFGLDLAKISEIWRYGSVVRSWLLDLTARALEADPTLSDIEPWVEDSGEGRWTATEAIDEGVAAPVITLALQMRFASRDSVNFGARLLAALRNQFGGHAVKKVV